MTQSPIVSSLFICLVGRAIFESRRIVRTFPKLRPEMGLTLPSPINDFMKAFDPRYLARFSMMVAGLVTVITPHLLMAADEMNDDPSKTIWYSKPAAEWEREALPIGNGRLGAMIFGSLGRERIALNEESMWSGSRAENNRADASKNLPEIRRLLLAGKNAEAEELVNQTFTCQGAGSGKGAGSRVPFGCYQALGDLDIVWKSSTEPVLLGKWKWSLMSNKEYQEVRKEIAQSIKPDTDDKGWEDYIIANGKAVSGGRTLVDAEKIVMRHHLDLTKEQVGQLGMLRIGAEARNGSVFVNGNEVVQLPGYQAMPDLETQVDVSKFLKAGDNVVAISVGYYRRHGQFPLSVVLESRQDVEDYRRGLDLRDAVASVSYRKDGVTFTREAISSAPDQVMAFRFTADKPGSISFTATLDRIERFETKADGQAGLIMTGQLNSGAPDVAGLNYVTRLRAIPRGGKVSVVDGKLTVEASDEVVLFVAAATNYQGFGGRGTADPMQATGDDISKASEKSYEQLRTAHVAEYHTFFDRVSVSLDDGKAESREAAKLPTDQRLAAVAADGTDPALAALYFNYGRYLLISSSRPGNLPANLQGIWAEGVQTPWNCDYHLDINVQMNYWPAEVCGLGDCHMPLMKFIESLQKPGAETAKAYYNSDGWVAHVITNVWGFTAPGEKASWGATASGSAWLCEHLWDHYAFTGDKSYLKWAYPIMKGSAEFYLGMLITEPKHGWLVTAPSNSPENGFKLPDGSTARICMGPTMDMQILRELFGNCIAAAKILGGDDAFLARLTEARAKLAPTRIGKDGQIMEWLEDYEEIEPHHRHVSPLYGLHPYDEITPDGTPELAKAARVTLEAAR